MAKLIRINSEYYKSEDGKYEVKKVYALRGRSLRRVWKLYENGSYSAEPDSIKMANDMIKYRESHM